MSEKLHPSAQKVQEALTARGLPCQVVELPDSTRTAQDAAQAIGCTVAQIVKSLVFRGTRTGKPILVLSSGVNRVSEKRMSEWAAEPIGKADADFVRRHAGFAIGGVPPVGHPGPIETYIDEDLFQYDEIWAAAGTPYAVFRLTPKDLGKMGKGLVVTIK
ncbi:MAG TPA: YbaK/EbsC family protein [Thermodesulfobacteriota bacterium]|nr:YbaK/EbsC family protein [Thermodesulfobacteriota bacterium]